MSKRFRRRRYRERMKEAFSTLPTPMERKPIDQAKVGENVRMLKVGIAPPPDFIYKYRQNREAPSQAVWGAGGTISYAPKEAKYVEGEGNFVYYYDCPFPSRTVAPVQAIHAIAGLKRLSMNILLFLSSLSLWDLFTKNGRARIITSALVHFNGVADMMVGPYYLTDGYYCKFAKEVQKFVSTFLISLRVEASVAQKTAEIISMFFEYDNAYRFRLQDMAMELNIINLYKNFPKEIQRVIAISATREVIKGGGDQVIERFTSFAKVLKYAWYIPSMRKALKKAIRATNFENCGMDEGDLYHTLLYGDYNVKGRTLEERLKILEGYHGPDQTKWPPRILIKPQ